MKKQIEGYQPLDKLNTLNPPNNINEKLKKMTSRDFAFWLQGWFELNQTIDHREGASKETLDVIRKHLNLVFKHEIDPSMGDEKHQQELNNIHNFPIVPNDNLLRC